MVEVCHEEIQEGGRNRKSVVVVVLCALSAPPGLGVGCHGAAEEAGGPGGHDPGPERPLHRTAEKEDTGWFVALTKTHSYRRFPGQSECCVSSQREKRLGLHGHEDLDLEDRKPPARVSSLRRKPSDPTGPRISSSRDLIHRLSGRRPDRTIRTTTLDKKTSLTGSAGAPPSLSLHLDSDSRSRFSGSRKSERWEAEEESAGPPDGPSSRPTAKPRRSRTSQSDGTPDSPLRSPDSTSSRRPQSPPPSPKRSSSAQTSSSSDEAPEEDHRPGSKPPSSPPTSITSSSKETPEKDRGLTSVPPSSPKPPSSPPSSVTSSSKDTLDKSRRPRSKPPLAPKPRIPSAEQPEKSTAPPDSPPLIRQLAAPTEAPPPPPPVTQRTKSRQSSNRESHNVVDSPPAATEVTPPDPPTAAPITEEEPGSADPSPPTGELPPSPPPQKTEDAPEEEAGLTSSTLEVRTHIRSPTLTSR